MAYEPNRISRRMVLAGLAVGGVGAIIGCRPDERGSSTSVLQPNLDATLRIGVSRDLANGVEDPYFTHTSLMVHEPLIRLGDGLEPIPWLAERWQVSEDGLRWTFALRRGVTFSDGQPFNSAAVIRIIERNIQITPRTSPYTVMDARVAYGPIAALRPIDDFTFEIVHERPYPLLEATMSNFFSAMFSPNSFAPNGDFVGIPATTGPFILRQWERGQFAILERNDTYWGQRPRVRRIEVRVLPDPSTRVSALRAGEVDALVELGAILPVEADQLRTNPDIVVGADPISITQYLFFNCSQPPFNERRLRQAVTMAVDREEITRVIVRGYGEPGKSLLSVFSTRWFSPKGTPRYDPAEAVRLARAVLGDRRVAAVLPYADGSGQARPYKEIAAVLQTIVRPLGIDIRLQQLEAAALADVTNRGEWNLRFGQLGWANGDPDFILGNFLYSRGAANTTSKGGYRNEEADQLVEAGRQERDFQRRYAIYERLQEIAAEEAPVFALYHEKSAYAHHRRIRNLRQRLNFQPTFDTVEKL
ncbi:MAG: peptide ABC transporter substrate-binding protein [Dehalococcoidia bacterium]|nr:MAG: peptide ABC transporter substrate-binding protein [Dehalococcoidia bacterium]